MAFVRVPNQNTPRKCELSVDCGNPINRQLIIHPTVFACGNDDVLEFSLHLLDFTDASFENDIGLHSCSISTGGKYNSSVRFLVSYFQEFKTLKNGTINYTDMGTSDPVTLRFSRNSRSRIHLCSDETRQSLFMQWFDFNFL
jgi:hypothetical protein